MKIVQNSLKDRFQKDYDMKLKFSGLISVVYRKNHFSQISAKSEMVTMGGLGKLKWNDPNGLCGRGVSSSQLCSQSIPCTNFCAHVTLFVCTLMHHQRPVLKDVSIKFMGVNCLISSRLP